jgi:hypothetical protein
MAAAYPTSTCLSAACTALASTRQIVAFDAEMLTSITPLLLFAAAAADSRAACGPSPTSRAPPITGSDIHLDAPRQEAKFKVNDKTRSRTATVEQT